MSSKLRLEKYISKCNEKMNDDNMKKTRLSRDIGLLNLNFFGILNATVNFNLITFSIPSYVLQSWTSGLPEDQSWERN